MPFKVKKVEHEGMFEEYDKNREVRLFKDAMKNLSLHKPMKYQNVSPERLREIKDGVYEQMKELRKSAEVVET